MTKIQGDDSAELRASSFAIVIPTKNEAVDLPRLLRSIVKQGFPTDRIFVIDNGSDDRTVTLAQSFEVFVASYGPNQSAQRNRGASLSGAPAYLFLDADMEIEDGLLHEIAEALRAGSECIAIPEDSIAVDLLGKARALERALYQNDESIQAARVFTRELFERIGGFDESMTGGEDWLLSKRAGELVPIFQTTHLIHHYEGRLAPGDLARKYFKYGRGYYKLFKVGPQLFVEHANPLRKSVRSNFTRLRFRSLPLLAVLLFYKTLTYAAGGLGFLYEAGLDWVSRGRVDPETDAAS
jgi:glycosyltransferase involved in cell wall biosynthesis